MWEIMPNRIYIADPNAGGSMHNRGIAVDITLIDSTGKELDMGVPFDYFGREAHPYYNEFTDTINNNRMLLLNTMLKAGFVVSRSEYWHYSLGNYGVPISDMALPCDN